MKIDLGKSEAGKKVEIDVKELITSRLLLNANSGGGKSFALRRILEQSHGKVQQIVLDLEGEFVTLREKYDYVLVGKDGDIPISIRTAEMLAKRLLELNVSAIIDMSELKQHERVIFVKRFIDAMINAPKELWHPCIVAVDEVHLFCPEGGKCESAGSIIDLATRGRKREYCAVFATQRMAKLSKDAIAECNNLVMGRARLDIDMKRSAETLGFVDKEKMRSLAHLKPGEFYAVGPAISNEVVKLFVGGVLTTHRVAGRNISPPAPTESVKKALSKLADIPKDVDEELRSAEDYRKKIAELKREVGVLKRPEAIKARSPMLSAKLGDVKLSFFKEKIEKEQAFLEKKIRAAYENRIRQTEHVWNAKYLGVLKAAEKTAAEIVSRAQKYSFDLVTDVDERGKVSKRRAVFLYHVTGVDVRKRLELPKDTKVKTEFPKFIHAEASVTMADLKRADVKIKPYLAQELAEGISASQQAILDKLAEFQQIGIDDVPKPMLAALTGTSPTSGGYFNNLGRLRGQGYIEYRKSGTVHISGEGQKVARPQDVPVDTGQLQERWKGLLSKSQRDILDAVIDVYPESIGKIDLADKVGVSSTSGGYFNNLGSMRTMGVIEYPVQGRVKATKYLFLEEI